MDDNGVSVPVCIICFDSENWYPVVILSFDVLTDESLVDVNEGFHAIRLAAQLSLLHAYKLTRNS